MTVLTTEMIRWSFAKGVARINLSTGRDQSKMGWRPREVLFRDAVQVSPTWRARAAFPVFRVYETASRARVNRSRESTFRAAMTGRSMAPRAANGRAVGSTNRGAPERREDWFRRQIAALRRLVRLESASPSCSRDC